MLNWDFFKFWTSKELDEQKQRTENKIDSLNKMLSDNPGNIFLENQINQQRKKLNHINKYKNYGESQ